MDYSELPTRRTSLAGIHVDGNSIELVVGISKQLYRCPGCRESVSVGADHVVARIREPDGARYHQHWHRDCAREILVRSMRSLRTSAI